MGVVGGGEGATLGTNCMGAGDIPFSDLAGEGDDEALDGCHIAGGAGEASLGTKRTGDGETDLTGEGEGEALLTTLTGDGEGLGGCHMGAGDANLGTNLTGDGEAPFWGLTGEGEALLGCQTGADTCEIT